jgi:hypothetical protein
MSTESAMRGTHCLLQVFFAHYGKIGTDLQNWNLAHKDSRECHRGQSYFIARCWCRTSFTTLPSVLLQEQPAVVLLLEGDLVSWSLAVDERGGHEDLRGSGHRSVIPYAHGRIVLYCSSLPCLSLPFCLPALTDLFFDPLKEVPT